MKTRSLQLLAYFTSTLLSASSFAAQASDANAITSVIVLPLKGKGAGVKKDLPTILDDLLVSAIQNQTRGVRVVAKADLDTLLGLEKLKDAVACDQVACATELAGALGVESVISGSIGSLGDKFMLSLTWIDTKHAGVLKHQTQNIGKKERDFDTGIKLAVSALLGSAEQPAPVATASSDTTYLTACKAGPSNECHALALQHQQAKCAAGDGAACLIVANVYRLGYYVPVDATKAADYYHTAAASLDNPCRTGQAMSCALLAELYDLGRGVSVDPSRARELARRAEKLAPSRLAEDSD